MTLRVGKDEALKIGAGDFSLFVEPDGEYMYLFYNLARVDSKSGVWQNLDAYVARTRKRKDGVMGDFVKYCNGEFCEPGNLGKEFGNHYVAIYPNDAINQPNVLDGNEFSILSNHNGTDVIRYAAKIVSK